MAQNYGRHLSFPFRIAADGKTAQVGSLEQHLRDEVIQLILTNIGERLFLPEFGGGVRRLVFESADTTTAALTKAILTRALSRWLGHRLEVQELLVTVEHETIQVDLKYRIAGTEETRVMRFQRSGGS